MDSTSEISLECLWYCFTKVLQKELDSVKEQWNTHRIRKSRNDSVPGRPDSLFFLPDKGGFCIYPSMLWCNFVTLVMKMAGRRRSSFR